jgi:pimeloyl-ACP methyl ester carboxylesterase
MRDPTDHRRLADETTGRLTPAIDDEVESQDLRDVVLVGHSYSGVPVGQAAERIGDRLARVVFVDSSIPADGEAFVSAWPDGGAMVKASIAEIHPMPACRRRTRRRRGHAVDQQQLAADRDGHRPLADVSPSRANWRRSSST